MKRLEQFTMLWAKWMGIALGISVLIGGLIAVIVKWPIIQGIYVLCFVFAAFSMVYASMMFIGTPEMRYQYLVKGRQLRKQGKGNEVEGMEDHGVVPALVAFTLILIGFALEASMH